MIKEILSPLSPREIKILRLRFGLENGIKYTVKEVGKLFKISPCEVRDIEVKALDKMLSYLK